MYDAGDGGDQEDESGAFATDAAVSAAVSHWGKVLAGGSGHDKQESPVGKFLGYRAEGLLVVQEVKDIAGERGVRNAAEAGRSSEPCTCHGIMEGGVRFHEPAVGKGGGGADVVQGVIEAQPCGSDPVEKGEEGDAFVGRAGWVSDGVST